MVHRDHYCGLERVFPFSESDMLKKKSRCHTASSKMSAEIFGYQIRESQLCPIVKFTGRYAFVSLVPQSYSHGPLSFFYHVHWQEFFLPFNHRSTLHCLVSRLVLESRLYTVVLSNHVTLL
jgi:hypothetical protein